MLAPAEEADGAEVVYDGAVFEYRTVVMACDLRISLVRIMKSPKWEAAARSLASLSGATGSPSPVTYYDPSVHAARAVTLGDGIIFLYYPSGRLVVYATGRSHVYLRWRVYTEAVRLVGSVLDGKVGIHGDADGIRLESMTLACNNCRPLVAALQRDLLWLDKLAIRHGPRVIQVRRCASAMLL